MNVRVAAVRRAVQVAGGAGQLAQKLGVGVALVYCWAGGQPVPSGVFLRATDLIHEHELVALAAPQVRPQAPDFGSP